MRPPPTLTLMIVAHRRRVLQPDADVIPQSASLYAMGLEVLTGKVAGLDLSECNKYR